MPKKTTPWRTGTSVQGIPISPSADAKNGEATLQHAIRLVHEAHWNEGGTRKAIAYLKLLINGPYLMGSEAGVTSYQQRLLPGIFVTACLAEDTEGLPGQNEHWYRVARDAAIEKAGPDHP